MLILLHLEEVSIRIKRLTKENVKTFALRKSFTQKFNTLQKKMLKVLHLEKVLLESLTLDERKC